MARSRLIAAMCGFKAWLQLADALGVQNVAGAPFENPDECNKAGEWCTLTLDVAEYNGPSAQFLTRGYNGQMPGPTIRISPGSPLNVAIVNGLEEDDTGLSPNSTNFHAHGLHVDPGGDDVFLHIGPGSEHKFEYQVYADHMSGSFYYHPHLHLTSSLQAGGGATGMIIIDDQPGEVPEWLMNMDEKIVIVQHLDLATLAGLQTQYNGNLWEVTGSDPEAELLLVNGQTEPVMAVEAGKWTRWRLLFSSLESYGTFELDDASCEMQLVAKDGAYLPEAPRAVTSLPIAPGMRCDIAVRCDGTVETVNFVAVTQTLGPPSLNIQPNTFKAISLEVVPSSNDPEPDLPIFKVNRPCYMASSLDMELDEEEGDALSHVTMTIAQGAFHMNGVLYSADNIFEDVQAGGLIEMEVEGLAEHPYHQHINHFQLYSTAEDPSGFFKQGDWHDTYYRADEDNTVVRFFTDRFTGLQVLHCHFFPHQDGGMMALMDISGEEGSVYDAAEQYDPTCYRDDNGLSGGRGFTFL